MKIKELEIISFRGIRNIKVKFNEKMSFLVAENNIGKTRILESIKAFYDKIKEVELKVTFNITDEEKEGLKIPLENENLENEVVIELKDGKHFYNLGDLKTKISKDKILGYYVYIPSVSSHEDNSNPAKPNNLRELFKEAFQCDDFSSCLDEFNVHFSEFYDKFSESSKNQIEKINNSVTIDGFEVFVGKTEITSDNLVKNNFELKVKDNGDAKNFNELGTGIQRNIINAILCTNRNDDFLIYLYDEPEIFLNPTAQKDLIEKLYSNNENSQFLIATHSPYCICRKANIFDSIIRLKKVDGTNVEIFQYDDERFREKIQLYNTLLSDEENKYELQENVNKGILKFWEINGINGLFEKKLLICEGPTEELFFDFNIHPQKSLPLINSLGKFGIPYYIIFFKDILDIKVLAICDKDSNRGIHEKLNSWIEENATKSLFLEKNLEEELGYVANSNNREKLNDYLEKHFNGDIEQKERELASKIITFWND